MTDLKNIKDENLKKDFKFGRYIYIALYLSLILALIYMTS